jgi:glycosyltransferase involved in cell wall biosynthesis
LTIGNANEDYYRNYGVEPTRFFRSSYPIDLSLYINAFQNKKQIRSEIRDKFKFKEDDIVCSVVGKLVSWKNQKDLINSLEFCKNNKVKLLIIGSGIMMEELRALASKCEEGRVCFSGFVDSHELPAYYAATDIYVHPSRVEPHSVAISEAIFMGCPVLLSNTTGSYGTYDDVRVGINGFVFENGDLKMIAKLIDKLAVNEKLRMQFSNESHSYAVSSQESAAGKGLEACLNYLYNA